MELSDTQAQELVTTLQEKRCAGDDDISLITWISNRYRIGKNESRALYDSFYQGFQRGADSVMESLDRKTGEPTAPSSADTVFCAAYLLGQKSFADEYDKSLRRRRPRGCLSVVFLVVAAVIIAAARMAG